MRYLSLLFFLSTATCWTQEEISCLKMEGVAPDQIVADRLLLSSLQGIVLVGKQELLLNKNSLSHQEAVEVVGLNIPTSLAALSERLSPYLHLPVNSDTIAQIRQEIHAYYKENFYPLVIVEVPNQDISHNVLQFLVRESRMGCLSVVNEQWTNPSLLMKYADLPYGEPINEQKLIQDVDFMNRNPFRRVSAIFAAGEEPYTTDVILYTEDRRRGRIYSGVDNTGIPTTGRERWYIGFNWGYAFWADQLLAYQYTASYDVHKLQSHTAQYQIFFPWKEVLNLYGGYSTIHPTVPDASGTNGYSAQASLRYTVPLSMSQALRQEISFGGDFKRTNNTFLSTEEGMFGQTVNLTQLALKYAGNYEKSDYHINFDVESYWSPGQWLPDQTGADFASLRPDAKNHWVYVRAALSYLKLFDLGVWFSGQIRTQLASNCLLPSEQLGLGGYDSVRGYDERQESMDSGVIVNLEFRSPKLPIFGRGKAKKTMPDGLQFLAFLDFGAGRDHNAVPDNDKRQFLIGVGPGVRYTLDPYLAFRLDWGFKLHNKEDYSAGTNKLHFSLTGSY
jgi:hemolysin activation/secretion protein